MPIQVTANKIEISINTPPINDITPVPRHEATHFSVYIGQPGAYEWRSDSAVADQAGNATQKNYAAYNHALTSAGHLAWHNGTHVIDDTTNEGI